MLKFNYNFKKSYYVNSDYNFTSFILTGENIDEIISFNMRKNFLI